VLLAKASSWAAGGTLVVSTWGYIYQVTYLNGLGIDLLSYIDVQDFFVLGLRQIPFSLTVLIGTILIVSLLRKPILWVVRPLILPFEKIAQLLLLVVRDVFFGTDRYQQRQQKLSGFLLYAPEETFRDWFPWVHDIYTRRNTTIIPFKYLLLLAILFTCIFLYLIAVQNSSSQRSRLVTTSQQFHKATAVCSKPSAARISVETAPADRVVAARTSDDLASSYKANSTRTSSDSASSTSADATSTVSWKSLKAVAIDTLRQLFQRLPFRPSLSMAVMRTGRGKVIEADLVLLGTTNDFFFFYDLGARHNRVMRSAMIGDILVTRLAGNTGTLHAECDYFTPDESSSWQTAVLDILNGIHKNVTGLLTLSVIERARVDNLMALLRIEHSLAMNSRPVVLLDHFDQSLRDWNPDHLLGQCKPLLRDEDRIYFKHGESGIPRGVDRTLTRDLKGSLAAAQQSVGRELAQREGSMVLIVGRADGSGPPSLNIDLSEDRAKDVYTRLRSMFEGPGNRKSRYLKAFRSRVRVIGRGEASTVPIEDPDEKRMRRVDILACGDASPRYTGMVHNISLVGGS